MNKHIVDQFSPFLFMGIMVLGVVGAAYYFWSIFNPASDFSAEDAEAIARYKVWIKNNDLPIGGGKIKPEELPLVYRKVIEHDIKTGDVKSARGYIRETIQKKHDAQVASLAQLPEAKELIERMQNGQRKVEALRVFVAAVQKQPGQPEPKQPELGRLAEEFCRVPFDASSCPEYAEEIAGIYKASSAPLKDKDEAVTKVIGDIEQHCLPRPIAK